MVKSFSDKVRNRLKLYLLDKYELELIHNGINFKKQKSSEVIFFQCPSDHFFLHLYSEVIKKENKKKIKFIGKIEIPITLNFFDIVFIIPYVLKKIQHLILVSKWEKLYKAIGISEFKKIERFSFFSFFKSLKLYFRVKDHSDLSKLKINNILVGDLIIDSIIRFRKSKLPTVNIFSLNTIIYYYTTFQYLKFYKKLAEDINIKKAFISQSVFIFHGVPLRQFFQSKVKVFSSASLDQCLFKEIKVNNDTGIPYGSKYKEIFSKNYNQKHIEVGIKSLSSRFEGNDDLGWFKSFGTHPYDKLDNPLEFKFNGILFLHDFYDGPHYYGKTLFLNFFEWTTYTLDFIKKNRLNIAIKTHPFQSKRSGEVCKFLKMKYDSLTWIENVSNRTIFKNKIEFGITQHGTVISELAYHKIKPIYCGDHPIDHFKIGFKSNSIIEYEENIINHNKLKFDKNLYDEIGKYYFMHHIHDKTDYKLKNSDGVSLKGIKNRFFYENQDLRLIYK